MRKLRTFFSLSLIIILLFIGIYCFFKPNQIEISEVEKRNFKVNANLLETNLLSKNFTDSFENILADQFIDRYSLVKLKNKINYIFGDYIYQFVDNPLILRRIGDSPIFRIGDSNYLMSFPILFDKKIEERIINRTQQINKLARDYPNVNFYVYKPTQIFETDFFDHANNIKSYGPYYDRLLRENLDVPYDSFEFYRFSDYPKYQYYTDHHWNHDGAQRGYEEIIQLMIGKEESLLKPLDINCFSNLTFSGTYSSLSGFVTPGAPFCAYLYDLPEYELYVNGEFQSHHKDTNNYFHKVVENRDLYHYSAAFELGSGFVEVISDSLNNQNLLIIGDSYAPAITPLIANHFNHIFVISPIRYEQLYGVDFEYDTFIQENSIKNVLFMYVIENYYVSDEWGDRYEVFDVHRKEDN